MDRTLVLLFSPILIAVALVWLQQAWKTRITRHRALRGYKKVSLRGPSNMADEYDDAKYSGQHKAKWRVKALFIHPIKSCAAVELDVADVDGAGFTWDRKFAFAELVKPQTRLDASEAEKQPRWTFRTQRQVGYEKLVHVRPEIWLPENHTNDGGFLVVKYPRIPRGGGRFMAAAEKLLIQLGVMSRYKSFRAPLVPPEDHQYPLERVTVWKDSPVWLNYGVHVPADFGRFLGVKNPLTLFRVDPRSYREVYRCAPRKEQLGYQPVVGFADAYPIHLLNLASVRDLGHRVAKDIPRFSARRFRANIVITGPPPYDEDDWKEVRIGSGGGGGQQHRLYCACHTVRCRLPNVDPDTAERHPVEPDKTLKSFRCIDDGDPLNACLGLQIVPAESRTFQLRVGDEVEVLERGEHHYIKQ